ncbi:MAG: cysteine--tRNA ligase [bacterium]
MVLKLYNTLTKQKEEFQPLDGKNVRMYVCGITPYDETHLGHGRAYVTFDIVRRWLEYSGYKVTYVQNVTDVDDKIIAKARDEGRETKDVTEQYTKSYLEVMAQLNVRPADKYPKATEHIKEMVRWIEGLMESGHAYEVDGDVYFEVAKFNDYGKLSNRKLDDMISGARVAVDERKKSPLDFALWKKAKEGEPSWDSPWGKGRPGWHIECSVMSTKYLGESFDIHGGGLDLVFPHHENEIAQTEAATSKPWVKYWLHNGFVNVDKQKMSKSLGNFFTLKDVFKQYDPMVVRFFLLSTHYRSPINYSQVELNQAKEAYGRITRFIRDLDFLISKSGQNCPTSEKNDLDDDFRGFKNSFSAAMDDDFNTASAIAVIFDLVKYCNKAIADGQDEQGCLAKMRALTIELCGILGLTTELRTQNSELDTKEIEQLITKREVARKEKDFAQADNIKLQLAEIGIVLEDTPQGTRWAQET